MEGNTFSAEKCGKSISGTEKCGKSISGTRSIEMVAKQAKAKVSFIKLQFYRAHTMCAHLY